MSNHELLELAAKAAGMSPPFDANGVWSAWVGSPENGHWWDPLADDGDALRLAVKLGLNIWQYLKHGEVSCGVDHEDYEPPISTISWSSEHGDDPAEATRRAIVSAAADIGRSLP